MCVCVCLCVNKYRPSFQSMVLEVKSEPEELIAVGWVWAVPPPAVGGEAVEARVRPAARAGESAVRARAAAEPREQRGEELRHPGTGRTARPLRGPDPTPNLAGRNTATETSSAGPSSSRLLLRVPVPPPSASSISSFLMIILKREKQELKQRLNSP